MRKIKLPPDPESNLELVLLDLKVAAEMLVESEPSTQPERVAYLSECVLRHAGDANKAFGDLLSARHLEEPSLSGKTSAAKAARHH